MNQPDVKPTRVTCTLKLLQMFLNEFFDQNPISQVGIIETRNKRTEVASELSGNVNNHITAVQKLSEKACVGEASLQNTLHLALNALR